MTDIFNALSHRMDYLVARQSTIASNIANADTPGYLAKDVTFASRNGGGSGSFSMAITNARHIALGGASGGNRAVAGVTEDSRFLQHNGNSVRQDMEGIKQAQTALDYRTMTQLYTSNMSLQRIAIGKGN